MLSRVFRRQSSAVTKVIGAHQRFSSRAASAGDALDVLVVGGGGVGASFACQVLEQVRGIRVGVVEARPPEPLEHWRGKKEPDVRVFAITPASARILYGECAGTSLSGPLQGVSAECRVWQDIADLRAPAFNKMQVWESVGSGFVRFGSESSEPLGYVAESRVINGALYDRLRALATGVESPVQLLENTSLKSLYFPPGGGPAEVELEDGRSVRARLVVGADGAGSRTRELAGIGQWTKDYDQRGVVVSVRVDRSRTHTAWQRFLPSGPLALLPLWDDVCSIVWSVSPEEARRITSLSPEQLAVEINDAFTAPTPESDHGPDEAILGRLLAGVEKKIGKAARLFQQATTPLTAQPFADPPRVLDVIGRAASFPLRLAGANEYVRPRIALIG
jgi:ubiquinone biosynthesis UbiH/UbiF/VisC/COQ6 family hydroxylase